MQPLGVDEPTVVGPYRLLGRLGSGGMGRVYLGRSAGGRTVAVKIVHPHFALDEEFRARFRREVDAARRVGGAWTAPVLDADPEARGAVGGHRLRGRALAVGGGRGRAGRCPTASVRALGAGLAEALAAVHELGLVHRDVKPSNVLLTLDGPLLIDFGIARATDGTASLTSTGVSIGSPGYMSPEQILGKGVDRRRGRLLAGRGAGVRGDRRGRPSPVTPRRRCSTRWSTRSPNSAPWTATCGSLVAACLAKEPAARPTPAERGPAARSRGGGAAGGGRVAAGGAGGAGQPERRTAAEPGDRAGGDVRAGGVQRTSEGAAPSAGCRAGGGVRAAAGDGAVGQTRTCPGPVSVPEPRDAPPDTASSDRGPGKLSVSISATAAPAPNGRGRRVSCTVALAVAGALAAVTVGSVFVFDLMPDSGGSDAAGDASSSASSPAPSASDAAGAVPARYVGTWEGQAVALDGTLPMGPSG